MEFISCETANDKFGKTEQQCNNGDVSIDWLQNANINTQNRAYQREKVAPGVLETSNHANRSC